MSEIRPFTTRIIRAATKVWHDNWQYDAEIPATDNALEVAQMWSDALGMLDADELKVAVCEYMLEVNQGFVADSGSPLIAPTAIDWLGDGIVTAIIQAGKIRQEAHE